MVRWCAVVVLLSCSAFVPPVAVARPSSTTSPGVTAERLRSSGGKAVYLLRFADPAARAYRRIAGQRARLGCVQLASAEFGASNDAAVARTLRIPRRRGPLRLETGSQLHADYCYVRARDGRLIDFAISQRGRTYFDERRTFGTVLAVMFFAPVKALGQPTPLAEAVKAGRGHIVALPGPDAAPPGDVGGYWTDGERAVFAATTHAGRRLFLEVGPGDIVRTNVFGVLTADTSDDSCGEDAAVDQKDGTTSCNVGTDIGF